MNLKQQRAAILKAALDITAAAKAAGRDLTPAEANEVQAKISEVEALDKTIAKATESDAQMQQLAAMGAVKGKGQHGYLNLTAAGRKSFGHRAADMMRDLSGTKSLMPAGEVATAIEVSVSSPIAEGRPLPGLLAALPAIQHIGPRYRYLRQTLRANAAAAVAPGQVKPTTAIGLTPITNDLAVIAHLTEPIDKFLLEDSTALVQFVGDELLYGLTVAVESQVLVGDGVDANMTGLLNTSGIQVQTAIAGDLLGTLRQAVTKLESVGHMPGVWALNPSDWERIELSKASGSGQYLFEAGPIDRAARKLWGVPVAISSAVPLGTAGLIDLASVAIDTDTAGVRIQWSESVGDDFSRNQIRARCEGRFNVSVFQGMGLCKVNLPAAA